MALSFSLGSLFGSKEVGLDDAEWLPAAVSHAPPMWEASGFDLAVQARMRRERTRAARAGEVPELALGPEPMSLPARRLWSLLFLVVGLVFLASSASGLLGLVHFDLGVLLVVAVVIGLVVTPIAGHRFLASFNPTLQLLADRDSFAPGDAVEVAWAFSRPPRRARGLEVVLRGEERATYRQGTSDTTATETFFEETVHEEAAGAGAGAGGGDGDGDGDGAGAGSANANGGGVAARGRFTLRIPADAMHSFESANNAVAWTLRARAPVPRWPDITRTVPLRVWSGPAPTPAREEVA